MTFWQNQQYILNIRLNDISIIALKLPLTYIYLLHIITHYYWTAFTNNVDIIHVPGTDCHLHVTRISTPEVQILHI